MPPVTARPSSRVAGTCLLHVEDRIRASVALTQSSGEDPTPDDLSCDATQEMCLPPLLREAFPRGRPGSAGGVAAGTALFRVDVQLADFPDAICNDGSGAAGSSGVRHHADRLRDVLRRSNVRCAGPEECPLFFRAVIDAGYHPDYAGLDYAGTSLCRESLICDYPALMQHEWESVFRAAWSAESDDSCEAWHRAHQPGTEWLCADLIHVLHHHMTTPFFVRQDLQDSLLRENFVATGFGDEDEFGRLVHEQLANLENLDSFAEEGSVASGGPP